MKKTLQFISIVSLLTLYQACNHKPSSESTIIYTDTVVSDTSSETDPNPVISVKDFNILIQQYEDPGRVDWQNPEAVLGKMNDLEDAVVADIGIGTGYFAFRLVHRGAKVIGIDIEKKFLDYIEDRKSELPGNLALNIETRLTTEDIPGLRDKEADWVLIVNTYRYLKNRPIYLRKLKDGLKPGGKILIVDFKIGDMPVGPDDSLKVPVKTAQNEVQLAGFNIRQTDNSSLQYQYILVAEVEE
ncbi:class I SAM-dependent methyltransferase [Bacteroidota bacterium]